MFIIWLTDWLIFSLWYCASFHTTENLEKSLYIKGTALDWIRFNPFYQVEVKLLLLMVYCQIGSLFPVECRRDQSLAQYCSIFIVHISIKFLWIVDLSCHLMLMITLHLVLLHFSTNLMYCTMMCLIVWRD